MFIGAYIYFFRFGMEVTKHVNPLLTRIVVYGIVTEIPNSLVEMCSDRYLIELYFNPDYNLKKVLLFIPQAGKIDGIL